MRDRHLLLPTVALALGLALTACGSDSTGSSETAAGSSASADADADTPANPGDAALAYAECMRSEGVEDFPDPEISEDGGVMIGGPGLDPDDPALEDAQAACEGLLDDGGSFDAPDPERQAEMEAQVLAFAECMREQGIDFPDPEVDGGKVTMRPGEGIDPSSPEFAAAQEACQDEMPDGPGGGGPGAGPGQP